jgi:hypothetical protein
MTAAAPPGAHEIVLRTCGHDIGLSCTCLRIPQRGRPGWHYIGMRASWPGGVAAAWQAWHAARGIEVTLR